MAYCNLSVNQLVQFSAKTDAGKRRIIQQQLNPDTFKVQWYQKAKACIRASISQNFDHQPVYDGLAMLAARKAVTKHQLSDKATSIEALERFLDLKVPSILRTMHYTTIRPPDKTVMISDVEITVAPEIVFRGTMGGKKVVGGVKIHICKGTPFDYEQSEQVAAVIYRYLVEKVALPDEKVIPALCLSLDIFGDRIVQAPRDLTRVNRSLDEVCNEVKVHWLAA
ncbi:MAG TPA: hypothetical protein PLK82_03315 [Bacteroidales bacterium]|nr:hypothetical protein [Bacteroidales bacterium]